VRPAVFVLLLLLGALMVVVPGTAVAAQDGDYTYTVSGGVATITDYNGTGGDIAIPSTLGGYTVVAIGFMSFWFAPVTSVIIPNSVTLINNSAFAGSALTTITIPDSVTTIGNQAFDACHNLTSVTIGSGVTTIDSFAFPWCTSLTSITFLGLVAPTSVGNGLIEHSNTTVRGHAYAASNFPVPGGVWNGLTMGTVVPATVDYTYTVSDGNATITGYTGIGGAITIPSTLGGYPVVAIGESAFKSINSLTSVTISDGVMSIEEEAFRDCNSLTSVTFPSSLTHINDLSFMGSRLTSVTIPKNVTLIGDSPFATSTLNAIIVDAGNPNFTSVDGVLYDKHINTIVECPGSRAGSFAIPGSVTSIEDYAFFQCGHLTTVTIPSNVTSIGIFSFCQMDALTSITIPSNVTSIGQSAFQSCTNLTSITFLGLAAPTSVGNNWIGGTPLGIRGHAYTASNFPVPGGVFHGLTMGATVDGSPASDMTMLILVAVVAVALVLVAILLYMRKKKK